MCDGSIFKVVRKEVNMNLDDYKLLKTKEIVAVLDGDEDFEISFLGKKCQCRI